MKWDRDELLCKHLLTKPKPEIGTVLVTGATGYVGGRLVPELLARGYNVRVMARVSSFEIEGRWENAEIVAADALKPEQLSKVLEGVSVAYYLIHSLLLGPDKFENADVEAAMNFRKVAEEQGVKRIIYLGALGDYADNLSPHLRSRNQVAEILREGKTPTTILRAAIIIGSGSASYEILKNLVLKSPVFLLPRWAKTKCQPISIRTLINILVGVLEKEETSGHVYDVGGMEVLTYEKMLRVMSKLLRKKKLFVHVPSNNYGIFSYFASLLTPVAEPIIKSLMMSAKNDVLCKGGNTLPPSMYKPISFKEALLRAMSREELDAVHTRWSDEYPRAHELALKLHELKEPPYYIDSHSILSSKRKESLFKSICKIGGNEGWFYSNWMWRLRGILDSILMGAGTSRGRRSSNILRVHDVVGFFRVEDIVENERLLLRAEMKLPGRAWLEFLIKNKNDQNEIIVTAYFEPYDWKGHVYWYNFLPFHYFLFTNLLKQIDKRS